MKKMVQIAGIENEGHFATSTGRKTSIQSLRSKFDPEVTGSGTYRPFRSRMCSSGQSQSYEYPATTLRQLAGIKYKSASSRQLPYRKLPVSGSQQNREEGQVSSAGAIFHSSVLNHCTINVQYSSH